MRPCTVFVSCLLPTVVGAAPVDHMPQFFKPGDLVVNQAADAIVGYLDLPKPLGQGATREMAEQALRDVVDQYDGTNVSHIFWNVCYQRAAYRSEAWASYWDLDDPQTQTVSWPRLYYLLHDLRIDDGFEILIRESRERGISPWVSLRMNDMHYHDDPHRMNPFWNQHPEYWILPQPGFNNGFDFVQPAVRAHYLKLVREVMTRWDVDGVELDWLRFPHLFKPGDEAAGRAALTSFMREVRQAAAAAAARLGHRVGIAARVPCTPEFSYGMGLDAVAWANEELVDVLIPGSFWRPSFPDVPVEAWRAAVGPRCQLVPSTDLWLGGYRGGPVGATSFGVMRGFTAQVLDRGADAVYLFNHFEPCRSKLNRFTVEAGADPEATFGDLLAVAGDPAQVTAGLRRVAVTYHDPVPPESDYRPPLPAKLLSGQASRLSLSLGPAPTTGHVEIWVGLAKADGLAEAELTVRLNGAACVPDGDVPRPPEADAKPRDFMRLPVGMAPRMLRYRAPLTAVRRGGNEVEVTLAGGPQQSVVWLEVRLYPTLAAPRDP